MNQEIAERVQKVIAKHLRVETDKVPLDATFEQLGMDSLDGVNLLFEVEDEFDISIDDQVAKSITSVPQMVDGIESCWPARRKPQNRPLPAHDSSRGHRRRSHFGHRQQRRGLLGLAPAGAKRHPSH